MNSKSKFIATLMCGLAAASTLTATPAHADTPHKDTCFGASCRGKDPSKTVCADDAVTLYSREAKVTNDLGTTSYGVLDMRYSKKCHSNWARYTHWGGWFRALGSQVTAGDQEFGDARIWREGKKVAALSTIGHSPLNQGQVSYWTGMEDATGRTCMAVEVYSFGTHTSFDPGDTSLSGRTPLGTFEAGCFS